MKRLIAKSTVVVAAVALTMFGGMTGAGATGAGAAAGTGTITPALTDVPQNTAVAFDGTAAGITTAPTVAAGTCNVHFQGTGTGETVATGNGSGSLTCSGGISGPGALSISCQVSYHRDYTVVTVTGSCGPAGSLTATCSFAPTSNPPKSYALSCSFALL
jgi:hypothetical protein